MSRPKPEVTLSQLRARLDRFPRLSLADLPTPLTDCPRLSEALGGPRILVKREDLAGLGFGGNKVRQFEYSLARAVEEGYDILVHGAASQSNHSRLTAAAAARLGLKAVMLGRKDARSEPVNGNLLLTHLFGAHVHLVDRPEDKETYIERLKQEGHKVYNTSTESRSLRSVAFVHGFLELWGQLRRRKVRPDGLYISSGFSQVGLSVAPRALGIPIRIVGISPSPLEETRENARLAGIANEVARMLDLRQTFAAADIESYGGYAGEAYGVMTEECREALLLAARTEGLVLDPVYTGKAFAGLIDHIRRGQWTKDQTVIFVHTGGTPALFAYAEDLLG